MNTIEFCFGTKSFSKTAEKLGHETFTVDIDPVFEPDCVCAVEDFKLDIGRDYEIAWASPPCTTFSVASIGKHWGGGKNAYIPRTPEAMKAMKTIESILNLVNQPNIKWWFIENPRGMLRKMPYPTLVSAYRHTVTYCQYGDTRMKPTDVWTNAAWWKPRPACKNGDACHESAPRGSRTGTQGLKGSVARGVIPPALFKELFEQYVL